MARQIGAHEVVDPHVSPPIDTWREVDGKRTLVIYEAVGVPGMLDDAMRSAPPGARILVVGVCMEQDHCFPSLGVVKELDIRFAFGYDPMEFAGTLQSIAEGDLRVDPLISAHVGIEGVPAAFSALADPEYLVKVLVEPGGPAQPMLL